MTWGDQTVTHVDCRGGKWDEPLKFQRLNIQISLKLQCFKDCGAFGVLLTLLNLELGDSLKFECWSLKFFFILPAPAAARASRRPRRFHPSRCRRPPLSRIGGSVGASGAPQS